MAGKTLSAYADEATARRVDELAAAEDRTTSQVAAAALRFWVQLPPEAHAALRQVERGGTAGDLERISRDVARALLHAQYDVAQRRVVAAMDVEALGPLESEDDILAAAVHLTAQGADSRTGHRAAPRGRTGR